MWKDCERSGLFTMVGTPKKIANALAESMDSKCQGTCRCRRRQVSDAHLKAGSTLAGRV